jgi:hypothetical protein
MQRSTAGFVAAPGNTVRKLKNYAGAGGTIGENPAAAGLRAATLARFVHTNVRRTRRRI